MSLFKKIFSLSNLATALTVFYLYGSLRGVYNLMYPMNSLDLSSFPLNQLVKPYWNMNIGSGSDKRSRNNSLGMKVYLSTNTEFRPDFIIDEFQQKLKQEKRDDPNNNQQQLHHLDRPQEPQLPRKQYPGHDSILLWEEESISKSSSSKSFILTKMNVDAESPSFQFAVKCLDDADKKEALMNGGVGSSSGPSSTRTSTSDAMNALLSSTGDGIETTSVILSLYKGVGMTLKKVLSSLHGGSSDNHDDEESQKMKEREREENRIILPISKSSSIWSHLMKNSTVHVHVILIRNVDKTSSNTFQETMNNLRKKQSTYNLLAGGTNLVKYDLPYHVDKPKRYLYKDILYIIRKYILRLDSAANEVEPWDMSVTKSSEYNIYQSSLSQKESGVGYPYWKPEVAVKLVSDDVHYPLDYVGHSGMEVIRVNHKTMGSGYESGYAYLPGLYVDEMGLTSEKYIPLNKTVDALPLRISFDSGVLYNEDGEGKGGEGISSSGGLSPARWRLLSHLSKSLESQKELGFEDSDVDDVRRLIADTNVTLLGITVLASTLHLLFEFLTFKNDVEFWRGNKDLTGLSVRALFMDFFSQFIILLFLVEKSSSLLMTLPAAAGCLIALWKCQKGAGFKFVKASKESMQSTKVSVWNKFFRIFGFELHAMRLRVAAALREDGTEKGENEKDLATLTEEMDSLATRTIGKYLLLPLVLGYTVHTLINEEHSGWYSWFITSASAIVYAVGFVMMTPQLFLNYKLKSVAHLPWKVLGYRFVNTFIDDLFAMIIRMPTMARLSCFRDDIVFIIYLWQRYLYPVDASRPVEGGGMDAVSQAATSATIEKEESKKKTKQE